MLPIILTLIDDEDKISFEKIYEKYRLRIYNISFGILQSSELAEDAASETFLYLAKSYNRIKELEPHRLDYYILLTARNTALDMIKKEKKHRDNIPFDDDTMLTNAELERYDTEYLKECIKKLDFKEREILYLRFNCGLDFKTISAALGITAAAARKRLQYAKADLRKLLEGGEQHE